MFLTICSWMAFCLCYTTFEAFLRPLYYFGEVSFKNLILSDICGVGYGSQTQRLTLHGSFDRSRSRLKLKTKYRITFLSYNLLTEAENVVRFVPAFLL
nr:hypothetical protein [Leptospira interrogans]